MQLTDEVFVELAKPFDIEDVYFLPQSIAKDGMATVASYADKRAYAERMDVVLGKTGWQCNIDSPVVAEFSKEVKDWDNKIDGKPSSKLVSGKKVFVTAHISVWDGEKWVTKSSTGAADTADENSVTTAEAQAVKRAISMWGPGNYFYSLPKQTLPYDKKSAKFLAEPNLPDWAIPEYKCQDCKETIGSFTWKDNAGNSQTMVAKQVLIRSRQSFNKDLCAGCQRKRREATTPQDIKNRLGK